MILRRYDGKCVKITDITNTIYEGICQYNDKEYNEHEFGRKEECLQILNMLFFKKDIKKIESLEKHKGPYGRFSESFGNLEEQIVEDGIYYIDDILFSEEDEHVYRLLLCLNKHYSEDDLDCYKEVKKSLKELLTYTNSEKVKEEIELILDLWD